MSNHVNRRLIAAVAGSVAAVGMLSMGAGSADAAKGDSRQKPGTHVPATELQKLYSTGLADEYCPVPATADDKVLVTMKQVLDGEGVSSRVRLATFETAWVESHANDLNCGDASSIGVFQQRPDYGWANAGDPRLATYDFLHGNPSDSSPGAIEVAALHPTWTAGQVAQEVQRSAYPSRYDEAASTAWGLMARAAELDDPTRDSGHATVSDRTGRVWMFAIKQSGTLMYRFTGSSGWEAWRTVSGTGYRSIAATLDEDGRLWTIVTMSDGEMKYRWTPSAPTKDDAESGWSGWSAPVGVGDWLNVSASTDKAGRIWMFATKTYGDLWYRHQGPAGWLSFVQVPGNWESVSSAVESDNGRVWMFGTKVNGYLSYRHTNVELSGWDPMTVVGPGWAGDVSATADNAGQIWMFGVRTGGVLEYRHTDDGAWGNFVKVGNGGWNSVSSSVDRINGQVWMFATKSVGDLWYRHTDGSSAGWTSLAEIGNGGWK